MTDSVNSGARSNPVSPHEDPARWVPRLRRLLERELDVCERLASCGDQQGQLIREGQTDALLGVLGRRQVLIDELSELNQELDPFRRDWDQFLDRMPDQEREPIRGIVGQITAFIDRINERDEQDRAALEQRRGTVASRLGTVQRGRGAVAAYRTDTPQQNSPMFQDREA